MVDFDLPTLDEIKNLLNEMIEMNEGSGILIESHILIRQIINVSLLHR